MKRSYVLGMVLMGVILLGGAILIYTLDSASSVQASASAAIAPDDDVHRGVGQPPPQPVADFLELGLTRAQSGDVTGAIEALEVAIAAAGESAAAAEPNYYLGLIYLEIGHFDEAMSYLTAATEADPAMLLAWMALGSANLGSGHPVQAIDIFTRVLEVNPNQVTALINRGQAYTHISANDRAMADFDRAIELDETAAAAYFNRGALFLQSGDPAAAVEDFTSVLDNDASRGEAHFNRAVAYIDLGETDAAINDLVIFLAFQPQEALRTQAEALLADLRGEPTPAGDE